MAKKNSTEDTKSSNKSKGGKQKFDRRNGKAGRAGDNTERGSKPVRKANDVNWYMPDKQFIDDYGNIPFHNLAGVEVDLGQVTTRNNGKFNKVPGIACLLYIPALGGTNGQAESNFDVAARHILTFIRKTQAGAGSTWEAIDMLMVLIKKANIIAQIRELKRMYGAAMTFSNKNRYWNKALLRTLGVDYDLIASSPATFRTRLNRCILELNSFATPADMPIAERWAHLGEELYIDSESALSQIYFFRMSHKLKLEIDEDTGTKLVAEAVISDEAGYADSFDMLFQPIEDAIKELKAEDTFNIMSGDIMKAYGEGNLWNEPLITDDYMVPIVHDKEMLEQLQQAFTVRGSTGIWQQDPTVSQSLYKAANEGITYTISQTNGRAVVTARIGTDGASSLAKASSNPFFNFYRSDVAPDEIITSSRLMPILTQNSASIANVDDCGSEIPLLWMVVDQPDVELPSGTSWEAGNGFRLVSTMATPNGYQQDSSLLSMVKYIENAIHVSGAFDYIGKIAIFSSYGTTDPGPTLYLTKWENYTTVSGVWLRDIHRVAVLNMVANTALADLK